MKKFFISLIFFMFMLNVSAESLPNLKYKNIENNHKIYYDEQTGTWSKISDKKSQNYYIKTKGFGDFYDYLDADKKFVFSTDCEYEFLYKGSLIGYSNKDMKFYDLTFADNKLSKTEIPQDMLETIFPEYKIIAMSDFSPKTNSLKIKKHSGNLKIILLNDTDYSFDNYSFSSGNAKFEKYSLRGFLSVTKPGMIQFSNQKESDNNLWYMILVR